MSFTNRQDAGKKLAKALLKYHGSDTVVYALPRGGAVLGYEVAKALGAPLDLVITRKIGHPLNPEYAICAVNENGDLVCDESERGYIDKDWLREAVEREQKEISRRKAIYLPATGHIPARNRNAVIVDDGIATGLTMRVAIMFLSKEKPKKLIVAVPVASRDTVEVMRKKVDRVVILKKDFLGAIGEHYDEFLPVEDDEVISIMKTSSKKFKGKKYV